MPDEPPTSGELPTVRSSPSKWGRLWRHPVTSFALVAFAVVLGWNASWLAVLLAAEVLGRSTIDPMGDPAMWALGGIVSQVISAAVVWLAAGTTPPERAATLNIRRPRLSSRTLVQVAFSCIAIHLLWDYATAWLGYFGGSDDTVSASIELHDMFTRATSPGVYAMLVASLVAAGVCEELVFRGFLMRRLLVRWSPQTSVGVAAFIFAIAHFHPTHVLAVLPVGVWLGYLAWKTNSTVTSIVGHVAVLLGLEILRLVWDTLNDDDPENLFASGVYQAMWWLSVLGGGVSAFLLVGQLEVGPRNEPFTPSNPDTTTPPITPIASTQTQE